MNSIEAAASYCDRNFTKVITVVLLGLFAFYQLEFLRYRPYDIDNPWFLSFSYGQHVYGMGRDTFLSQPFPLGMDGTYLFGRVAAWMQTAVAVPFGWQQRPVAVLSALCIALALACFTWALRRRGHKPFMLALLLVTAGISEPVLSAAVRLRYEPFSYLFVSVGLLLTTFDQTFLAVLVAALAIEIQPAAILGVLPVVLASTLPRERRPVRLALSAAAILLALGIDLLLHPAFLHPASLIHAVPNPPGSYKLPLNLSILVYFDSPRHITELMLLIAGPFLFLMNGRSFMRQYRWELASVIAIIAVCPILRHANPIYIIFLYPPLLLLLLVGLRRQALQALTALAIVLYFIPQYAYAAWINRGQGYTTSDMLLVNKTVLDVARNDGLDPSTMHIVGDYSLYFAHPRNFRGSIDRNEQYFPTADIVLCFDRPNAGLSRPGGFFSCHYLEQSAPGLRSASDIPLHGNILHILARPRPSFDGTRQK